MKLIAEKIKIDRAKYTTQFYNRDLSSYNQMYSQTQN